jgi:hypothetical protein
MTLATVLFSRTEMTLNRISDAWESDVDRDLDFGSAILTANNFGRHRIAWILWNQLF